VKKFIAFCFAILLSNSICVNAFAVENNRAKYIGGTVASLKVGSVGHLDTTSDNALIFSDVNRAHSRAGSNQELEISYRSIKSFEYSHDVKEHLGVLPAILVTLFRARPRRHVFQITYCAPNQTMQVVVFEVPKQMPVILQTVLKVRTAQ
jgi:hypothetical protein